MRGGIILQGLTAGIIRGLGLRAFAEYRGLAGIAVEGYRVAELGVIGYFTG